MSIIKQTLKNTMSGWISIIIRSILSLITIPLLLKSVGSDGFGLITILGTIVGLSVIIDLGLRSALGRTLSEQVALGNKKAFTEIITTALLLYILISLLFSGILYFSAPFIVSILNIPDNLNYTSISLIRLYGILGVLISFIIPVFSAALQSHHRFDICNKIQTTISILSSSILIIMIKNLNFEIIDWVIITLIFQLVNLILLFVFFRKQCEGIEISKKHINFKRIYPLFKLGGYMYIIQLSGTISDQSNPLIISSFSGVKAVGIYQPALNISQAFTPIVMTLTSQLYPIVTKYHVENNKNGINNVFNLGAKYTLLLGILVSVGVFFFAEPFAKLWLYSSIGDNYLIAAKLMQLFAIADLLSYLSGTQWPILLGMNKLKYLTIVLVSTAILNIGISIYLVGFTDFGVYGVLYGTIISKIIRVVLLNNHIFKLLNISFIEHFKLCILGPLLCLILLGLSTWFIVLNFSCETWIELFYLSGITCIIWIFFIWLIGLNANERNMISKGKFRSLLK